MGFAGLDTWLCDLEAAVESTILKGKPRISPDRPAKLSAVEFVGYGKSHRLRIAGQLRFAVRDEDGVIFGVEGDVIRRHRSCGRVGEWEGWGWGSLLRRGCRDIRRSRADVRLRPPVRHRSLDLPL